MALRNDDPDLIDGTEVPFQFAEEPVLNDRKRYTAQLQRRAQAHITAELGGSTSAPDIDRQVTMVVQHARESTGARRVSFFRPVQRGRRWHVATLLQDGSFYYGLAAPDTLQWPRQAFDQKRPILADDRNHLPIAGPGVAESFGDDLGGHAGGDEQRGVGVSQVVKSDPPHRRPADHPVEGLRDRPGGGSVRRAGR